MGFFDSLSTGLSGLGSLLGSAAKAIAPPLFEGLAQAGTSYLLNKIAPKGTSWVPPGGYGGSPYAGAFPQPTYQPQLPSGRQPLPPMLPPSSGWDEQLPSGVWGEQQSPPWIQEAPTYQSVFAPQYQGSYTFPNTKMAMIPSVASRVPIQQGGSQMPFVTNAAYMPGGAPLQLASLPGALAKMLGGAAGSALPFAVGALTGALSDPIASALGFGGGNGFFRSGQARASAVRLIMQPNPVTGAPTFWRHVGQPVLFSGDLATCRRVRKVVSRYGRSARRPR